MRTYRDLFTVGEFRALFTGQLSAAAGTTVQALALSVLVYAHTGSPLLAAVAFLAASLPQAVGAMALSGTSDRLPPRLVLVASDCVRAAACLLLASGLLPVAGMLAVVSVSGVAFGALGGVRYALVARVLPIDSYVLGRSALNTATAAMQVAGYAAGGGLLATVGASRALWVAFALAVIACLTDRFGLRARPARGTGRSFVRGSWAASWSLLSARTTGRLLLAQWLPNGLIVGAEALYVPYAGHRAAILFSAGAVGMLAGNVIVGRYIPQSRRPAAAAPLYVLLALPYLAFAAHPALWQAVALVALASIGFGGTLCLQQRMVEAVPERSLGQAFALASAGMLTTQGLASYLAGGLAEAASPGRAMAAMAVLSIVATFALLTRHGQLMRPAAERS